ncbi:probable F-box protein At1g44080 [Actinidia eriantha]|uniref:probable F-box protein At1g44080 n=1 Tax=Actinidia eriantha TaxID=165200 RepID=UPI00258E5169|nr:probable F-box protein At1g44080 [Actinidia eriantha]XP_057507046.1 probable F-box protein At1g44080 [Actinidia eriantha]XP_057507047.1 probable F-box protein At1g44080 [Actinidia eriantha]XP_057507048.1 probable F-box protein At1g44080 [Actinidia eriantha]XP_057507049.1 probable F-box protein At1g44080 [Actinidia eriantha]XP_057507050.1 probable F-box protein At1g44080 [Actinidia eriantha]XP_057507051.1 probable F-box protein At1g44080 [Actinidia eriantha]
MLISSEERLRPPSPSSSDWAKLPEELLDLILCRLIQVFDYLRFSAVCKPWLSVAAQQKHLRRLRDPHKQVVPMLLMPEVEEPDDNHGRRKLYSVTQNKFLKLEIQVPYRRRCSGSSHGWLATVEEDFGITLFNPFSGKSLRFPQVNPQSNYVNPTKRHLHKYEYEVLKVVLSCDPSLEPDHFVVFAIYGVFRKLAYIKPGHKSWTYIQGGIYFADVIYRLGKFYVIDCYSGVVSVDVNNNGTPQVEVVPLSAPTETSKAYIVESSSGGDLLLVQRFLAENDHSQQLVTSFFKIFKLLGLGGGGSVQKFAERVEIDSLGGDALFLGDNYSLAVSASNFLGCRPNCIYYTDDYDNDYMPYEPYGPRDMGIYSLEDKSFTPYYQINTKQKRMPMPPPIWIVPTLL